MKTALKVSAFFLAVAALSLVTGTIIDWSVNLPPGTGSQRTAAFMDPNYTLYPISALAYKGASSMLTVDANNPLPVSATVVNLSVPDPNAIVNHPGDPNTLRASVKPDSTAAFVTEPRVAYVMTETGAATLQNYRITLTDPNWHVVCAGVASKSVVIRSILFLPQGAAKIALVGDGNTPLGFGSVAKPMSFDLYGAAGPPGVNVSNAYIATDPNEGLKIVCPNCDPNIYVLGYIGYFQQP